MSKLAIEILTNAKKEKVTFIDLGNCGLNKLPSELFDDYFIENLQGISLGDFYYVEKIVQKFSENDDRVNFIKEEELSKLSRLENLKEFFYWVSLNSQNKLSHMNFVSSFAKLQSLYLSCNKIKNIEGLNENLQILDLSSNEIKKITKLPENLLTLNLSNNKIDKIEGLNKNLQTLILWKNDISRIDGINENLRTLNLWKNKIRKIEGLNLNLKSLFLGSNQIKQIDGLNVNLQTLDLQRNLIENIEPLSPLLKSENHQLKIVLKNILEIDQFEVNLYGNPITIPPIEIIAQGNETILNYFEQLRNQGVDFMYEAKMLIVGEGESGKTTLARKINNIDCPLPKIDDRTMGITINIHKFKVTGKDSLEHEFKLNFWDFGGQEIYHSTHRFFLSKRSIYVLVADNRKDDTDFNDWLNTIELYAGDSPVIIVLNEKGDIERSLNKSELMKRFPESIKGIVSVNFKTFEEKDLTKKLERLDKIKILVKKIEQSAELLKHIGEPVPASWTGVRDTLEADNRNYMYRQDFDKICSNYKIYDEKDINTLLGFFHDLGIVLNYRDNDMLRDRIIKPSWATNSVYKIFDDGAINKKNGRFTRDDCRLLWEGIEYRNMDSILIELMKSFKLIYEIEKTGRLIAPQKLPKNTPNYTWERKNNSYMEFRYGKFMPKGILWDFMIQMYGYIENHDWVWKEGVILKRRNSHAEVIENIYERRIYIRFSRDDIPGSIGDDISEFRGIVTDMLDKISRSIFGLEYEKMIPCICSRCRNSSSPYFYDFENIYNRKMAGKLKVECELSYEIVSVLELLNGFKENIYSKAGEINDLQDIKTKKKLFISYSHAQTQQFITFNKDLKNYLKSNKFDIVIFDDFNIPLGESWDEYLQEKAIECDIMILLVSQEFINSEYIKKNEFGKAIEKLTNGNKILISPIYFAPCNFQNEEDLKDLQFFKPNGINYGEARKSNEFSYCDLIKFNEKDGTLIENNERRHYIKDYVDKLLLEIEKL